MAPKFLPAARYRSRPGRWQPDESSALAVALALVVLDLDLYVLGLVAKIVGILQRLVIGLDVRRLLVGRGLLDLLGLGECQLRRGRGRRRRSRRSRRSGGAATAPDLHEVLAIVLTAALGAFDRALVQIVEARRTVLAGALGAPGRLDHAGSPGNSAKKGLSAAREGVCHAPFTLSKPNSGMVGGRSAALLP